MNTTRSDKWQVTGDKKRRLTLGAHSCHVSHDTCHGFTLIELLVVIAIIAVLVGFTIPALDAVKKHQVISQTQAEMGQLNAAIQSYHAAYGFYPPDNPGNALKNQLYYELVGATNTMTSPMTFQTLDGASKVTADQLLAAFGYVSAFVNCSKFKAGEEAQAAQNFLRDLRPNQTEVVGNVTLLVASVGGPDADYAPVGPPDVNPWRYNSSNPTNNPGAYELWVQLSIFGKTNLICNWSKTVQVNSPLP
jgi:prepilin-type N-terminal cleavage/methylation domain-containing protein